MIQLVDTNPVVSIIGDFCNLFCRRPVSSAFQPTTVVELVESMFPDLSEESHRSILRRCAVKLMSSDKGLFLMENSYFSQHFSDPDVGWKEAAFQTLLTKEIESPEELCTLTGILNEYR